MNSTSSLCLCKNLLLYASYTCGEVFTKDFWLLAQMKPMSCKETFSLKYSFVSSNTLALKSLMSSYSWKSYTICLMKVRLSFGSLQILSVLIYPAIFSVPGPELAWNPPPNKYAKQRGIVQTESFFLLMHEKLKFW